VAVLGVLYVVLGADLVISVLRLRGDVVNGTV
jgi:hypothetical protein